MAPMLRGPAPGRAGPQRRHGVVVESVNVSVFEYGPVRSASVAPMCWRNVIATPALETGPVHAAGAISTRSASGSENAPFVRWPGSDTESAASPAVEITFAVVVAAYSLAAPGVNAPNEAGAPSVSESVAGTVPPTSPLRHVPTSTVAVTARIACPRPAAGPVAAAVPFTVNVPAFAYLDALTVSQVTGASEVAPVARSSDFTVAGSAGALP